ncbi:MAG: bifunctional glutamate N-acetyltransferase/amino-acid acetyltransferase ArgJ [Acidimicrobiia bacterium]|nr:bifunctional glutamate N-acetyltransferase/amino-acid acetyltransferase ArgJ [Acidimicrobiia bacterium]
MSVTAAAGFEAAGVAAGIKPSGDPDLALVATAGRRPVAAAGVFTSNLCQAAPVQVSRRHLRDGRAVAVVLSSGNANAATGAPGRADALGMCERTASELGCATEDVLVCSTGLIGYRLPMPAVEAAIPTLVAGLRGGEEASAAAAEAMLTTDTVRKEAVAAAAVGDGIEATVGGVAKGAAMLAPSMATMLAVLTTDAAVESRALHAALERAVDVSFNQLSVDGCTSTNDTVLVLASGAAGNRPIGFGGPAFHSLGEALTSVCSSLAEQMAADAEGATKLARIVVRGARSVDDARRAARAVARSQLVQCSLYGGDPYWGRVLSELGASGARFDPEAVEIAYNGVVVCRDGVAADHDAEGLAGSMEGREIEVRCDLRAGGSEATVLTTDLTHAYIDENRRTS